MSSGMAAFLPVRFFWITLLPCLWNLTMLVRTVATATPLTLATYVYGKTSPSKLSIDPYRCFTRVNIWSGRKWLLIILGKRCIWENIYYKPQWSGRIWDQLGQILEVAVKITIKSKVRIWGIL